jgi:hypothetical protein
MGRASVTDKVLVLLQEWQDRRKEVLDAHSRNVCFAVDSELLLDTEHALLRSLYKTKISTKSAKHFCKKRVTFEYFINVLFWFFFLA